MSFEVANNDFFSKEVETEEEDDIESEVFGAKNYLNNVLKENKRAYSIKSIDKRSENGSIESESKVFFSLKNFKNINFK